MAESTLETMASRMPIIFVLGCPGAGKSTLSTLLTDDFPMRHISVGDLLRRIKNDASHPQAEALAFMLKKQKLIDGNVLVPILSSELERLETQEQGNKAVLVDGFPRDMSQLRTFELAWEQPALVLLFNCPKYIAKRRYLTRNLKGREVDDEAMFEKRYEEYVRENEEIVREYRERKVLLEFDTSKRAEVSRARLHDILEQEVRWMDIVRS